MKYLLCMFVLILLTIPFDLYCYKANAALVSNNISHSEVDQFIVLNCQTDECQGWFSELILNMNEEGQEDLAEEPDLSSADEEAGSSPSTASAEAPAVKKEEGKEVEDEEPITYLPGQVLINEIMSAPLPGDPEWVELFNSTNEPIDLTNWVLLEGAGKQTQLTGQLSAGDYIVFDKSSLNNGGDSVVLQDPSGQVIDQVSYGDWNDGNVNDNAPAAESGNSLIWHESEFKQSETATPGQMNIFYEKIVEIEEDSQVSVEEPEIPAVVEDLVVPEVPLSQPEIVVDSPEEQPEPQVVYQFSDKVIISEFMADPEGSDDEEWIELYNASDEDLNLLGWSLDDAEGGSNPFVIKDNLIIKSQDYLVIKKEESGLVLNNSSDSVRLLDPNLKLIDQYEYQNPKTGSSFSWFEDGWLQTSELTPAQVNEKPVLQTANYKPVSQGQGSFYKTVTIEQIKDLKKGSKVRIQGVVTVLPGVFGKNYIYVNGLQVYYSSADWPELQIGNQIEVSGSVSESYGEKRILVKAQADIKVLELQTEVVPLVVKSLELTTDLVGSLLQVQGKLVSKEGSKLIMADDYGEFTIYLKQGTGISGKVYNLGDKLEITGVLGQYNDQLRVMPRSQDDMINQTWQAEPVVGSLQVENAVVSPGSARRRTFWFLGSGVIITALANLFILWRKRWNVINFVDKLVHKKEYKGAIDFKQN